MVDPNGDTLFTDVGATTLATTNGAVVLSNMDPFTSRIGLKVGSRNATLKIANGIKSLSVTNTNTTTNNAGAAIKYTTGNLNPYSSTVFLVPLAIRRTRLLLDMLLDVANTTGGTGGGVNQICHNNGQLQSFSGAGFGTQTNTLLHADKDPYILVVAGNGAGQCNLYREDILGGSGMIAIGTGRTLTDQPTHAGLTVLGRNAADLWYYGELFLMVAVNAVMSAAEIAAEVANIKAYLAGLGLTGLGITTGSSAPRLVYSGDSNSVGTGTPTIAQEWGPLLAAGLRANGYPTLEDFSLGAASRQFTHEVTIQQSIQDIANGTSGPTLYVPHLGENDATVVSGATIYSRAKGHFTTLKANCPRLRIVWPAIPARVYAPNQGGYDANRAAVRALLIAVGAMADLNCDDWVDLFTDSLFGPDGSPAGRGIMDSDNTHYNAAGATRLYNGTDGSYGTNLFATAKNQFDAYYAGLVGSGGGIGGGRGGIGTSGIRRPGRGGRIGGGGIRG